MSITPYYSESGITIYCGDCRDVLPQLEDVQAIVSDPPYGIDFRKGSGGKGRHFRRNLEKIHGDNLPFDPAPLLAFPRVILWGANHYAHLLPPSGWLVWDKLAGMESFDSFSDVDFAWIKGRQTSRLFRYLWKGICRDGENNERREHPSQKPVALMKWCISQLGDLWTVGIVCDPYMGSGTTLRAAKDMGLHAVGIEIEERYCEIAVKRLRQSVLSFGAK